MDKLKIEFKDKEKLVLVGNPNVGKSVLFGRLTGKYAVISNYPGTTIEVSQGTMDLGKKSFTVIDTPGTNSLLPKSEDEKVTRDILIEEKVNAVLQVIDSKHLKRSLLLTFQLIEMGLPLVLNLNMIDESRERGIDINRKKLAEILGIDINQTVAVTGEGISSLKKNILEPKISNFQVTYNNNIEMAIKEIAQILPDAVFSKRLCALMLLAKDETIWTYINKYVAEESKKQITEIIYSSEKKFSHSLNKIIMEERQKKAEELVKEVMINTASYRSSTSEGIGKLCTKPLSGIPILLGILYLVFKFVGELGAGTMVDFIESVVFGEYINPFLIGIIDKYISTQFVKDLLVGEYGLQTVGMTYAIAIVLPIVATFFLVFGFLEDSGYFPRLTVLADRIFRAVGLNGKAVLPCVLGLGCGTMACLTCRILETKKERVIATLLLALGIPCSAQLGVIMGVVAYVSFKALLVIFFVVLIQLFIVGKLAEIIIPGKKSAFIIELPPMRLPQFMNIVRKTYSRIKWFLGEAVPLFLLGTFILFCADKFKVLPLIEKFFQPIVKGLLGLPIETTKMFIMGFLRRDYGVAGMFDLIKQGKMDPIHIVVSMTVITLFIPCIANLFVMFKERGVKVSLAIMAFVLSYSILVGTVLNWVLRTLSISF